MMPDVPVPEPERSGGDSFAAILEDLLADMESGTPEMRGTVASALSHEILGFSVGDESFTFGDLGVEADTLAGATVHIVADTGTVGALVDGRTDLVNAARNEPGFDVIGPARALSAADRAVRLLVLGAVRSPLADSFHRRLQQLCNTSSPKVHHP